MPQPTSVTAMTSSWPAWTFSDWDVSARAATLRTMGNRLPEQVNNTSFISTNPWPLVKLETRPPAMA